MDISRRQLDLGKRRNGGQALDFIVADADFLPFKPRVFDIVIASGFLHHCAPRHEVMIRKISLILKHDGRLIVIEGATIGPKLSLFSILFFFLPLYLSKSMALLLYLLSNPSKLKLPRSSSTKLPLTGDQKARMYPLCRPRFVTLLSNYFRVVEIRYYTWLSALTLNILVKIKDKEMRKKLVNTFQSPLKILDKAFCHSLLRKYSHIYSIYCKNRLQLA